LKPKLAPPVTGVGIFPDMESAGHTVSAYMASGAAPSMLELMDGATVAMINAFGDFGLPDDAGALLLVQSDAAGDSAVAELESFQPSPRSRAPPRCSSPMIRRTPRCSSPPDGPYRRRWSGTWLASAGESSSTMC